MLRHPGLVPLSRDHHHALALCVRTERAFGEDASAEAVAQAASGIVEKFDAEILDHFEFEERVLFPVRTALPFVKNPSPLSGVSKT